MSGNTLTVVSAVVGIVVGFLTSWWFTRSAKRDAEAKRMSLVTEISALRGLLSGVAESVTKPLITHGDVEQALRSARSPDTMADAIATSVRSAESTSKLDVLVRTSLGALLNGQGEVSVPRLLQAVARALPDASLPSVLSSLEELRAAGRVSWSGDDVRKAGIIKVHPQ
jgi:hypothetical protein